MAIEFVKSIDYSNHWVQEDIINLITWIHRKSTEFPLKLKCVFIHHCGINIELSI